MRPFCRYVMRFITNALRIAGSLWIQVSSLSESLPGTGSDYDSGSSGAGGKRAE